MIRLTGGLLFALFLVLATPATHATFHFARVVEIFGGTAAHPDADYIVIKAHSNQQNQFLGVAVEVYDAQGNALPDFGIFTSNLPSTLTNQRSILMAAPEAAMILGITPDGMASRTLPESGVVCFRKGASVPECVAYGNYTGPSNVGGSEAGPPAALMLSGVALLRDLGVDGVLQSTDDTNNSKNDFDLGGMAAENFAGVKTSELTISKLGGIRLAWTSTASSYTVHKTDDPAMVRGSAPFATQSTTFLLDPNPNQFSSLTCYLIKP